MSRHKMSPGQSNVTRPVCVPLGRCSGTVSVGPAVYTVMAGRPAEWSNTAGNKQCHCATLTPPAAFGRGVRSSLGPTAGGPIRGRVSRPIRGGYSRRADTGSGQPADTGRVLRAGRYGVGSAGPGPDPRLCATTPGEPAQMAPRRARYTYTLWKEGVKLGALLRNVEAAFSL